MYIITNHQSKLNIMNNQNEKNLKFLWSTFCGKENSQEEHYFVDEDNLKMYMKLTDIYTDELIKWEEIINPETIIWVYGIHLHELKETWV